MKAFEDKVVVLTGASSGIGYSLLKYFINEGAIVYASSRNEREITEKDKQECHFELLDLSDEVNVEKYTKVVLQKCIQNISCIYKKYTYKDIHKRYTRKRYIQN